MDRHGRDVKPNYEEVEDDRVSGRSSLNAIPTAHLLKI